MAFKLTQAVIDDSDTKLTLSEWAVLVVLSRHADDDGRNCFPSLDTLVQKTHACVDTVRAALKGLVKKELISYTQAPGMKRNYTLAVPSTMQGVGKSEGVGKVQGVGDLGGVGNAEGVGEVHPVPSEKSYPTPRKSPTRKEQEKNTEEKQITTFGANDIPAPSLEDYGIDAVTDFQLEPPDVTEDTDAPAALPGFEDEAIDKVPVQAFVDIYNAVLGEALGKVQKITGARRQRIRARYRDIYRECKCANDKEGLYMTREFFEKVNRSNFLMGRATKWRASFDWITKAENYTKISEGNYDNGRR